MKTNVSRLILILLCGPILNAAESQPASPAAPTSSASREFEIHTHYLNFPIKTGGTKHRVTVELDGRVLVKNEIELADAKPDWWAPMDVSPWQGQTLTIRVNALPPGSQALSQITPSDVAIGTDDLYREPLRAQFHFSPKRGWNNDPNGLSFYHGEYHLFFQHNPYGWSWGNMHWGHAVSTDLVHWRELTDVMAPDQLGAMFSGSAVVDHKNTSGFGSVEHPAQVLIYTAAGPEAVQCLAYSTDGRAYTKFTANPVLKQITPGNRDPKVIWYEPEQKWVMSLYVRTNDVDSICFLDSKNLKDWTLLSRIDGYFECPDFFELPLDGDPNQRKWVLTAANSEYQVGRFDGIRFTPETNKLPGQRGRGFYAAQTFSNIPKSDGRRIQIGWLQTETRGMPFNQSMTVPLELNLVSTPDGPRLTWTPVKELASLRSKSKHFNPFTLEPAHKNPLAGFDAELVELTAAVQPNPSGQLLFNVRGAKIACDFAKHEIIVNGHRAPAPSPIGGLKLTILCDRTSLEIFAGDGLSYVPISFQPDPANRSLSIEARDANIQISQLDIHELKSAWSDTPSAAP